jgi:hypothetical protein
MSALGVQPDDIDGLLDSPAEFLGLYIVRKLAMDFLFDAAARTYIAHGLCGDVHSFLLDANRERARKCAEQSRPV